MNKAQWATAGIVIILVFLLFFVTQGQFFGERKAKTSHEGHDHSTQTAVALSIDTIIHYSRESLTADRVAKVNALESKVAQSTSPADKLHSFHQLAAFWRDSARIFAPYAWYTAEAARLENSEKSLTFAAHLFLDNLSYEENQGLKQWEAAEAKDLFQRSLKLNPDNDSATVGLGAAILYGGSANPMEGIQLIRSVVDRDSTNLYAQMTLAKASLMSGQLDKALERLQIVYRHSPSHAEAVLLLAEVAEQMGKKAEAIKWYEKSVALIPNPQFRTEVQKRITELKK